MADMSLPPKNHNNPPALDPIAELTENLVLRHITVIRQADEYVKDASVFPATFAEEKEALYASDFIKRAGECFKVLESNRAAEKKPYWDSGLAVDAFFKDYKNKVNDAISIAEVPLKKFLQKKADDEKREREKDAADLARQAQSAIQDIAAEPTKENLDRAVDIQHAAAVAQKIAEAPTQVLATVASKTSRSGLKTKWVGKIKDISLLDLEKLRPYLSRDHLQVALNAYVKNGHRELVGADIVEETDVNVR